MDSVIGNVTASYPAQHPQLEGAEADQRLFGDSSSVARSYVLATPLDARRASLAIGEVEGATKDSIYEIYSPGSRKFAPPEQPVAKVQLTTVGPFSSEAKIVSGKITAASRAVEREHRYGSAKTRLYLSGLQASPVLQSIRTALQPLPYIEVVNAPSACHMQLRQVQGKIQTLAPDLTSLSTPVDATDPEVVDHIVEQVKLWAKFFNVLSIRNATAGIDVDFSLKGSDTRDPMARIGKPDMGVWEGESVNVTLKNNSERDLYIALLDLSSDGSITVIYPRQGAKEVLKPGLTFTRSLTASVPRGRSRVTDILKVFASFKPIDLSPLTQGAIRGGLPDAGSQDGGPPDPLQQLLMDSTGLRNLAPEPQSVANWGTVQKLLVIKKKG